MLKQCVVILKQLGDFITLSLTEVQVIPVAQIHRQHITHGVLVKTHEPRGVGD